MPLRALVAALALTFAAPAPAAAAAEPHQDPGPVVVYAPPVDGPVLDPLRPPSTPYGRGNRGVEYDTEPGDVVRAAAPGRVTFAGSVAGRRYVTVLHGDGVRTTYGPLASIGAGVAAGASVDRAGAVGTAGDAMLWTARLGRRAYVDPAELLAASGTLRVRLVPDRVRIRPGPR
jgi:murein DD-endopeptidase MepM/ murein hydrolase activator NlpD